MRKICIVVAVLLLAQTALAQQYSWKRVLMDGSRAGVTVPSAQGISENLGEVKEDTYYAPNGKVYKGGAVTKVAKLVIDAQEVMAPVKQVIGYSPEVMEKQSPESALSNWTVDVIMKRVEKESGRKVHVGITNFGGIRIDMPKGDIIIDDMMSMFPFRNNIVYVAVKGSRLREIVEQMAENRMEVVGGMKVVVSPDRKLVSCKIDGKPIDDSKIYGLATISFLLHGGDGLRLGEGMEEVIDIPIDIYDVMKDHVVAETAAGRPITYQKDGRVTYLKD